MRLLATLTLFSLMLSALGCSSDLPPLAPLTGTVMLDGQPFANGSLVFSPTGGGRPSVAVTDENGEFSALYLQNTLGALLGKHTVSFEPAGQSAVSEEQEFSPPAGAKKGPKNWRISPGEVKVEEGGTEVSFTLES